MRPDSELVSSYVFMIDGSDSENVTSEVLKTASGPKAPPLNFWHEVQWQILVNTGLPWITTLMLPQRHDPVLVDMVGFEDL